ncbi:type 4 pilus major pilin [Collimonas humicola]|uniref:type 4 pilus major pilin n=1 Tax=Collimonas humicola TaxID=2825886 RepID=UPI001B8B5BA3|nr:type 4 pilus major pilin [Collimonas humicola]
MKNIRLGNRAACPDLLRQRGASLLEGVAYLGIAAIVILGAVSLMTSAFSSAKSNRGMEEVSAIRTGVMKMYVGQANSYPAQMNAALAQAGVFPNTLNVTDAAAGTVKNSWGGDVAVTGSGSTFTITYSAVPQDTCTSMVSGASGWSSISQTGGASNSYPFPISPTNAAAICSVAGNAGNSIDFVSQ